MRRLVLLLATLLGLTVLQPRPVLAARWGSSYGDPDGFCPEQSLLPGSYASIVTNDPSVPNNPEKDTFWGIHANPGYDDWYGRWYGDFAGKPGDDSGWKYMMTVGYGQTGHWNFADYGWQVHGHAKQYIAYYNWTFGGQCGLGWYGSYDPPPYMADVYGNPVLDIYVDSVPPYPPAPRVTGMSPTSVTFSWDPVSDRGDGAGQDYWEAGMDHYTSWITVDGGPPQQLADSKEPRSLTASGLSSGRTACVHVRAFDALANGTPDQQACATPVPPPPAPAPPPASQVWVNPSPVGLTGLDAWFWLQPAPRTVTAGVDAGGFHYEVTQTPQSVAWSFGDGATATYPAPAGYGAPYPSTSPVRHVYDRQSQAGYPVSATVTYALTYDVYSFGRWWRGGYPMGSQTVAGPTLLYPVQQAQAEVVG